MEKGGANVYWRDRRLNAFEYLRGDCRPGNLSLGRSNAGLEGLSRLGRGTVLVVAAHPDDETIAVGCRMASHHLAGQDLAVVYGTNGRGSWKTRRDQARSTVAIRQKEALSALQLLEVTRGNVAFLGYPDGGAYRYFTHLVNDLVTCVTACQPALIYVHGFEGGHEDHDIMNLALRLALADVAATPRVLEWAEYNAIYKLGDPQLNFPDRPGPRDQIPEESNLRHIKQEMLMRYESQGVFALCQCQAEITRLLTRDVTAMELVARYYGTKAFWMRRLTPIATLVDRRESLVPLT